MGKLKDCISIYERLRAHRYKIIIEDGTEFVLSFGTEHFHHLLGFHYLTDLPDISSPSHGTARFYRQVKNGKVDETRIEKSVHIEKLDERTAAFSHLEDIIGEGDAKIIVEFDNTTASSQILAKYFLYKVIGDTLMGGAVTYYMLFIGYDKHRDKYYPATYIVEHSRKYASNQTLLNCKIEII